MGKQEIVRNGTTSGALISPISSPQMTRSNYPPNNLYPTQRLRQSWGRRVVAVSHHVLDSSHPPRSFHLSIAVEIFGKVPKSTLSPEACKNIEACTYLYVARLPRT